MLKTNPGTPFHIWIVNDLRLPSQNSQNFIYDFCSLGKGLSTTKDTGLGRVLSTTKAGGPLRHNSFPDPEPEYRGYPETNGRGLDPRRFGPFVDDENDSFKIIRTDVSPSNEPSIPQSNIHLSIEPMLTNAPQSNEPFQTIPINVPLSNEPSIPQSSNHLSNEPVLTNVPPLNEPMLTNVPLSIEPKSIIGQTKTLVKFVSTTTTKPSFASVASKAVRSALDEFEPDTRISSKDGMPVISFSPSDLDKIASAFNTTIIMSFPAEKPQFDVIEKSIESNWGLLVVPKVAVLDFKYIMVLMTSEQDVTKALSRESRKIKGFFFKLARRTIDFDPKRDSPFAPVWVQFPGLKLHLQNNEIIKEMAGLIDKYFITDTTTLSLSRPSTARVCIEVNLTKDLPTKVGIELTKFSIMEQAVICERLPMNCMQCCLQGHNKANCTKLKPIVLQDKGDELRKRKATMGRATPAKDGNNNKPTFKDKNNKQNNDVPELGVTDNIIELLSNKAKLLGTRASQQHTMATTMNNNTLGIEKVHLLDTSTNNKIMHSPKVINTAETAATNSENVDVEIHATADELAITYDAELELTTADSASAKYKNVMENLVSDGELTAAYGSEFEHGFHSDMEGGTCKDWTPIKKVCSRPHRMPLSVITRSKSAQQPPN
ncbi:hypothetical protein GIB67_028465 [Kingdonia uniflora]|uniref:DUF4283 domain-containing protein n=1 Tax=Kingdonia uniflora TaxID=39325 RepID=A0A7J7P135_9MAGN|nr:hypothetical protein GIB67_028465 [Kingdonia uniflora]